MAEEWCCALQSGARLGRDGTNPTAQGSDWAQHFMRPASSNKFIHNAEGGEKRKRDHNPFYKQVLSENNIFSTEGKADLHVEIQTFKTYTQEKETIFSHKLKVCFKLSFPKRVRPSEPSTP